MFNLFKSKSKKEKLETEYFQLTQKAFELENKDIKAAANVWSKANQVMMEIVKLQH